jgi:hypothetical protein
MNQIKFSFFKNANYNAEIRFNKDIPQFKKINSDEKKKIIGYDPKIKKDKKDKKDKKKIKIIGHRKLR